MSESNKERVTPAYIRAVAEKQITKYGWLMLLADEIERLQTELAASSASSAS